MTKTRGSNTRSQWRLVDGVKVHWRSYVAGMKAQDPYKPRPVEALTEKHKPKESK